VTESDLHKTLRELNNEIESTKPDDEQKQTVLMDIQERVQKVLDEPEGNHHLDLPDSLQEAALMFEAEYPSLARALETAINSLSAMGL
jgi:quinol monooxygenase YgiN